MAEYFDYLYEDILELLPLIGLGLAALLLFIMLVIPQLIRLEKRIELSIKNRKWMPRWLYKEQEALLSLTPVVELFAPYDQHTRDLKSGERRPVKHARFTSWGRASRTA